MIDNVIEIPKVFSIKIPKNDMMSFKHIGILKLKLKRQKHKISLNTEKVGFNSINLSKSIYN